MSPLHRPSYLFVLTLLASAAHCAHAEPCRFFDIDLPAGRSITAEAFRGVLPHQILALRGGDSPTKIGQLHKLKGTAKPEVDYLGNEKLDLGLRGDYAFTQVTYRFEADRLIGVSFTGGLPVPARDRVERCYDSLVDLLGEPEGMYHLTTGRERTIAHRQLAARWKLDDTIVIYRLCHDNDTPFLFELEYVSARGIRLGKGKDSLPEKLWKKVPATGAVKAFLDRAAILPEGDGGFAVIEPAADLPGRLRQYHEAVGYKGEPIWSIQYQPLVEKLEQRLVEDFRSLGSKEKVYGQLLAICEGYERGFLSGEVQCGAAAYLANFDDPAALPFLLKTAQIEVPAGIAMHSHKGIARQCSGRVMDRILGMLGGGKPAEASTAYAVLLQLQTEAQIDELEAKIPDLKSQEGQAAAAGALAKLRRRQRNS